MASLRARRLAARFSVAVITMSLGCLVACGGSVKSMVSASQGSSSDVQIATHETVVLVPRVYGGEVGWCARPLTSTPRPCLEERGIGPVLAEEWVAASSGEASFVERGVAVTTSKAVAVTVEGGTRIATRTEATLPAGVRTVGVEVRGGAERRNRYGFLVPSGRFEFTPRGPSGEIISRHVDDEMTLRDMVPAERWRAPRTPPPGHCVIRARLGSGVRAVEGATATSFTLSSSVIGEPLLACASVKYELHGSFLVASVLIDARSPQVVPGPLPVMSAVPGYADTYSALGSAGTMAARRTDGSWVVVSGGQSLKERLDLLTRLHTVFHP
jgi:hypothetical protein